jgi:hypothetical protein
VRDLLYAASAMRFLRSRRVLVGVSVVLPESVASLVLPEECACCAAAATHRLALGRGDGASLLVGYCDECAEHQAGSASRVLALALSSLLLGLVGAAGLPLLFPNLGLVGLAVPVLLLAVLPLAVLLLPVAAPSPPHACRGVAVFWDAGNRLLCAAPAYGAQVAALNAAVPPEPAPIREGSGLAWLCAGPVLGVGAACLSFFVYHPLLRVINLGPVPIEVALDGRRLVLVDPTSNESPSAGAIVRAPAGEHVLSVKSKIDGGALGQVSVDLHSGSVHLFAFAADDTCFWLETSGYGREQRAEPSYQPLTSADHFWVLPGGIDTWFARNPGSGDPNARSSGGLLTALRQAPCSEAPQEVRSAQ